jgi:hypothetical protein
MNVTVRVWMLLPAVTLARNAVTGTVTARRALLATAVAKLENQVAADEVKVLEPV